MRFFKKLFKSRIGWKNKILYDYEFYFKFGIIANIYRMKQLVNNSKKYKKYSTKERELIMKGLDLAIDRAWCFSEESVLSLKDNNRLSKKIIKFFEKFDITIKYEPDFNSWDEECKEELWYRINGGFKYLTKNEIIGWYKRCLESGYIVEAP